MNYVRLGVNCCCIASSVWLNGFNMSVSPLISVSVLQADLQLAVHGEYTGGFANKRRDNSVLGRGEIGNRWGNCSNCCLCFDMTN